MKSKHLLMAALVLTVASFAAKADAQIVNGAYSKTSSSAPACLMGPKSAPWRSLLVVTGACRVTLPAI